nr:RNA-directed DNA polymerase, eukaryota [Tanacetum cinerariifolium]
SLKLGLLNSLKRRIQILEEESEGEEEEHFSETKVNDLNQDKDNDFDHVSESSCMRDFNQVYENISNVSEQPKQSDDPFGIYKILKRNKETIEAESEGLKFPPGFAPEVVEENVVNNELEKNSQTKSDMPVNNEGATTDKSESNCVPKFRACGSILEVMDEVIKMNFLSLNNQGLGHKAKKGWIQEMNNKYRINFVAIQETKMGRIDLFSIKALWGNLYFDYAFSPSVVSSGGILCAWDPSVFIKENITISNSFVAIRGTWTPSSTNLLVITVYAPQDMSERRMIWDYFGHLIDTWDGECVLLGDFNEFRSEQERYGTTFNHQGVYAFNNFINIFLISDGLLALFPSLSALCLDRNLYDHMPILLRKLNVDYGPTPFCIFHSWFHKVGFDKLVEDTWKNSVFIESNKIINLKKKFKALRTVTYEEIKRAVWDCGINKSLGPDGFTFEFFRTYWNVIDIDVVAAVFQFFSLDKFPRGCNASFISLIPKMQDAKVVKDFRPISLIGSMYKIIAKILANRLSMVILDIDHSNLSSIVNVLKCFFLASGLKINLHKSKLVGIGIAQDVVNMAANQISCLTLSAPFTYLGVKVGGIMSRITSWDEKVDNGDNTSFWNDVWLAEVPLKLLFSITPRDGIEEEQPQLLRDSTSTILLPSIDDRWIWMLESSGDYSVKSAHSFIYELLFPSVGIPTRWVNIIPININIFAWRVCLDKLPTRLHLSLRGIDIPSIIFPSCSIAVESILHLLFSCHLARQIMLKVARSWDLEVQDFHSYGDWLFWFNNLRLSKRLKEVLEGVFYIM